MIGPAPGGPAKARQRTANLLGDFERQAKRLVLTPDSVRALYGLPPDESGTMRFQVHESEFQVEFLTRLIHDSGVVRLDWRATALAAWTGRAFPLRLFHRGGSRGLRD